MLDAQELELRIYRLEDCVYKLTDGLENALKSQGMDEQYETLKYLAEITANCRIILCSEDLSSYYEE